MFFIAIVLYILCLSTVLRWIKVVQNNQLHVVSPPMTDAQESRVHVVCLRLSVCRRRSVTHTNTPVAWRRTSCLRIIVFVSQITSAISWRRIPAQRFCISRQVNSGPVHTTISIGRRRETAVRRSTTHDAQPVSAWRRGSLWCLHAWWRNCSDIRRRFISRSGMHAYSRLT